MMNKVLLPERLTAENGAKYLLIGEFFTEMEVPCPTCRDEDWYVPQDLHCSVCEGEGVVTISTPVAWSTIKEIYKKVVKHYVPVDAWVYKDLAKLPEGRLCRGCEYFFESLCGKRNPDIDGSATVCNYNVNNVPMWAFRVGDSTLTAMTQLMTGE